MSARRPLDAAVDPPSTVAALRAQSGAQRGANPWPIVQHRRIPASAAAVSAYLADLAQLAADEGTDGQVVSETALLLGETLNNIVEHASEGPDKTTIDIKVTFDTDAVRIDAIDNGRPLPLACLLDTALPAQETAIEDLPEGGFGWFIIHQIAGDIAYERVDGENRLMLSIPV